MQTLVTLGLEQTRSEISSYSIRAWGLKVNSVLIGWVWLTPYMALREFRACNMDWVDEPFRAERGAICFARSCLRQQGNCRSAAGGRWMEVPCDERFLPTYWLRKLKVHGRWWLVAFSSFLWKSENFQLKQFGDFNTVSRQVMSHEKTDLSKPISIVQKPMVGFWALRSLFL